ncbi:Uncharacterised protein [Vibrio cholerae]|uniref:Uncharacterized protein n=1 Tax=Vibrio cholerae TaxID=666 RepID=A0A656A089_VIBCL|nr:Uncharacterised protein [Vibrio cholerae]CSD03863.1 Uncharacterised protein [Vibrio cholerae]CSI80432.1 Uncharacterised protein [Vibrio cholerae]
MSMMKLAFLNMPTLTISALIAHACCTFLFHHHRKATLSTSLSNRFTI